MNEKATKPNACGCGGCNRPDDSDSVLSARGDAAQPHDHKAHSHAAHTDDAADCGCGCENAHAHDGCACGGVQPHIAPVAAASDDKGACSCGGAHTHNAPQHDACSCEDAHAH
ncbi:MAG: hypothetical protein RR215_04210, partial [Ruthenibacterium sp.]